MSLITGPTNRMKECGHEMLEIKAQEFMDFLHAYLHGRSIKDITVTFNGKFFKGVKATVTMNIDDALAEEAKKVR